LAKRIFELARELGVTSKLMLGKCRAEGLEVKNHMSTVSAGLAATIHEWFSDMSTGGSAVETTVHVDLEKAHADAKKVRRRQKKTKAPAEEPAAELQAEVQEPAEEHPPAQVAEAPVAEAPAAEAAQAVEAQTPAETAGAEVADQADQADEADQVQAEKPPVEELKPPQKEKKKAKKPSKPIKVAGPQVVPRPPTLKGPRVIRVEKPETTQHPRRRPPVPDLQAIGPPTPGQKRGKSAPVDKDESGRKPSRRSPRRRGGRTASGAKTEQRRPIFRDQDLQERSASLATAVSGGMRRHRASGGKRSSQMQAGPAVKTGKVDVEEPLTVKNLSAATGIKSSALIKKLMEMGVLTTVNQIIGRETAESVLIDFDIELAVRRTKSAEEAFIEQLQERPKGETTPRAPVVTFLGHVDHGKTSLLDYIRKTAVTDGEAGGITQHIGAYRYDLEDKHVIFLDTPGHEAFTAMRARGANMTDVVVLVVAADDGVMPQTIEAINHAKAAEVPIVVALNKIDVPNANPTRALGQLAEQDLQPREWGGQTEVIQTSAVTGEGIETLLETLSLEAELLELQAETDAPASGYIIEAEINPGLGAVARLLILSGTLRVGEVLLAGKGYGRVRQMTDSTGKIITEAPPATPVEVSGLNEVPEAGDRFFVVDNIEQARSIAEDRRHRARTESLATGQQVTLENLFSKIEADQITDIRLIVKADVQGSVEALLGSLNKLSTDEIRVNILHSAVGGVSTGDVALAEASNAIILGFNVVADPSARQEAEAKGIDIRLYRVIYDIIEDISKILEEGLAPEIRQEVLGQVEVRQTFKISRVGTIAGCYVTSGVVQRGASVRIIRDNVVIEDERQLESLKRFKDDAREVRADMECGLKIANYDDIKEGDVLEFYRLIEVARKL